MKDKFNKYCAEVMWYAVAYIEPPDIFKVYQIVECSSKERVIDYNPYDDLNQRVPVVTELLKRSNWDMSLLIKHLNKSPWDIERGMHDFIISTMPTEESER